MNYSLNECCIGCIGYDCDNCTRFSYHSSNKTEEINKIIERQKLNNYLNLALDEIESLEDNWNSYGAKKFNKSLIDKVRNIISDLTIKPHCIFPTGRDSIQLEWHYDNDNDNDKIYLEIEIWENYKDNCGSNISGFLYLKGEDFYIEGDVLEEHINNLLLVLLPQKENYV